MRLLPHGDDPLFAFYDLQCVSSANTVALVWRRSPNLSYLVSLVTLVLLSALGAIVSVHFKIYSVTQAIIYFAVCGLAVGVIYLAVLRMTFARRRRMPALIEIDARQRRIVKCARSDFVVGAMPLRIIWLRGTISTSRSASTVLEPVAQIFVECADPSQAVLIGSVRRFLGATPPKDLRAFCKKIGIDCATEVASPETVDHLFWKGLSR